MDAASRRTTVATGASGDITLALDRLFEEIALDELCSLDTSGLRVSVVTEEAGESGSASPDATVVLDPIDGSTNVAHGLPQFSLSIGIASGDTMADVWFGFVFDFGTLEEFVCERDSGTEHNGQQVEAWAPSEKVIVGFESAEPRLLALGLPTLAAHEVTEIRVVGSIAISLCYVGMGRLDGLITCKQCRSVDAAAGQLFASNLGADIRFDADVASTASLSLGARYRLVAGRKSMVEQLLEAQRHIPLVAR